ncbi:MAG: dihydrofolate reductase [Bacilli bacterium]|nr:dihydrofolate reductase [Bacilli bacterium]
MINIIAAVGKNLELGLNNKLIWNIPEDLKYFKDVTTGKTVVMGRKTYESIGRPLPNRNNIVLTRKDIAIEGVNIVKNYEEILNLEDETFIIGGESIYELFLPYADNLYLTEIDDSHEADSYFPYFDKELYEKEVIRDSSYNDINYSFVVYKRVK